MICQNCNKRKGTETWVGEGSMLNFTHGYYQMWCKICCLEAQLEHAKKLADTIPKLTEELEKLRDLEK